MAVGGNRTVAFRPIPAATDAEGLEPDGVRDGCRRQEAYTVRFSSPRSQFPPTGCSGPAGRG